MGDDDRDEDLRTSLRDFRGSVSQEFARVDERFRRIDARFEQVDARLGRLEAQLGEFQDETRARVQTMETAILNSIRDLSGDVQRGFADVTVALGDHDRRLRRLEGE